MVKLFATKFLLPFAVLLAVFALLFWALRYFQIAQIASAGDVKFYVEAVVFAAAVIALVSFIRALLEQSGKRH
jgi:membrane protein implicated in regulation of membrane protease activity